MTNENAPVETSDDVVVGRKVVRYGGLGWYQAAENLMHGLEAHAEEGRVLRFAVVEAEGVFHARPMQKHRKGPHYRTIDLHHHTRATVYQPIHPSMTLDDVEGAVYARDDGTHWHFAHESPAMRHEAEAYAQAKLIAHFQPRINKQGALVHAAADITERTLRHNVLEAYNLFVDDALDAIETSIRKFPLGHFHRTSPHADNHRALAVAAVRSVLAAWTEQGQRDTEARHNTGRVKEAVDELVARLTQAPTILSRVEAYEAAKPKVATQIAALTMVANGAPNGVDLRNKFTAPDALEYTAVSSDEDVATVSVSRGMLTVTPGDAGSATITVRATAPDKRYVTQTFSVTVVAQ